LDAAKLLENTTDETPNLLLNIAVLEKYSLKIRNKSTAKPFVAHPGPDCLPSRILLALGLAERDDRPS
jgi:hypothetical protein